MEHTTEPRRHGGGRNNNLTQGDLQMIETIKRERPTLSLRENYDEITEFGDIPKGTSRTPISRALNNILSGLKWEKISTLCEERFTVENMAYIQMFIDLYKLNIPVNSVCDPLVAFV